MSMSMSFCYSTVIGDQEENRSGLISSRNAPIRLAMSETKCNLHFIDLLGRPLQCAYAVATVSVYINCLQTLNRCIKHRKQKAESLLSLQIFFVVLFCVPRTISS